MTGVLAAWGIALTIAAVAAITIACALAVWDDRNRPPAPPPDVDPALARPISAELRQAIAERENGNG